MLLCPINANLRCQEQGHKYRQVFHPCWLISFGLHNAVGLAVCCLAVIRAIRVAVDIDSLLRGLGPVDSGRVPACLAVFGSPVSLGNKSKLV